MLCLLLLLYVKYMHNLPSSHNKMQSYGINVINASPAGFWQHFTVSGKSLLVLTFPVRLTILTSADIFWMQWQLRRNFVCAL